MLTWKTRMWEKPRQPTGCRKHYERRLQRWKHKGNDLSHFYFATRRLQWKQRPLSLSHALSLCTQLHTHCTTTNVQQLLTVFALSHIYTQMTFGLFTHMAPRGSLGHIYICVPFNRSKGLPSGLRSSGSP